MKKNNLYKTIRWLSLSFIILLIDFYSKKIILIHFKLYECLILTKYLNIFYIKNFGFAFSFFSNLKTIWKFLFVITITFFICFTLIYKIYNQNINQRNYNFAYSLIIGGALGNLYDRLIHGFVIDFIDFHILNWHLAIFNIADIAISIGLLLIFIKKFKF